MRGDKITVLVDIGEGKTAEYVTTATKAGRNVTVESRGKFIEVQEVTRSGEPVRTNRFMPTRIVAIIEDHKEAPLAPADGTISLLNQTEAE